MQFSFLWVLVEDPVLQLCLGRIISHFLILDLIMLCGIFLIARPDLCSSTLSLTGVESPGLHHVMLGGSSSCLGVSPVLILGVVATGEHLILRKMDFNKLRGFYR